MLMLDKITRLVFAVGDKPAGALILDNLRLERDVSAARAGFPGLYAFDFGTSTSPVMEGFTQITRASEYSSGRGWGLLNARIWHEFDALQPDPLYQDFLCIEAGGLAVNVSNGTYRVFVNIDSPSAYWGEFQNYRRRAILAEGRPVFEETMDFDKFRTKYYRFWNTEDGPNENTFDKYQKAHFNEKRFDVEVSDGQLNIDFKGTDWACCVSAVVIFPVTESARGEQFLEYVQSKRRFHFDNYFKRILHASTGDPLQPSDDDRRRGYVVFQRDFMQDVFYNDTPFQRERGGPLRADTFAGEYEPLTVSLVPTRNLGKVALSVSDLTSPSGAIPSSAIDVGYVSYRITRVNMQGSIYTISPRLIMPGGIAEVPAGMTRQFWLTIRAPIDAKPGIYRGTVTIRPQSGESAELPVEVRVRAGSLDSVDIPVGPFGFRIRVPWFDDDRVASRFNARMTEKSLRKLREYGFTTFSGLPAIPYRGGQNGKPLLDFRAADAQMKFVKDLGFLAVASYGGGLTGFDSHFQDTRQMAAAGFTDYAHFVRSIHSAIQDHANRNGWIPVYYNLADEPGGDELARSIENVEAYRKAFPHGPPFFTGETNFTGNDTHNPEFLLCKALQVAALNGHDEAAVNLIHRFGGEWAFYNGPNRWTYGIYMFKAAKQFGMKFRLGWHWNNAAGDPYYPLDCREDDFAWCNSSPDGQLIPSVEFERLREGLDDYRRLLTLSRLAAEKLGNPAAAAGRKLIDTRLAAFHLGQRDHDSLFPPEDWADFRRQIDDAIETLRK